MPVSFFPNNPIEALEKIITNSEGKPLEGEIHVYQKLFSELTESNEEFYVWHDLKFATHSDSHNPKRKSEAQIDFLLICKFGICVIEVKGGFVEIYKGDFHFNHNGELKRMDQNPVRQVEGYKYTLKDKILIQYSRKLFIDICVFPFTNIDFTLQRNLFGEMIYTNVQNNRGISLLNFILKRFNMIKSTIERNHNGFRFEEISNKEIGDIINTLSPSMSDTNPYLNIEETYKWLGLRNFEIFSGLSKNQRVLIEGIPGCGKTTFALAYADQRRNQKGLYLCWNKLLSIHFKSRVENRGITNLIVKTYYSFLKDVGLNELNLEDKIDDFRSKVITYFSMNLSLQFDYIIIDEGQDLINRGVDYLLDKLSGNGKGLANGHILFLCDNEQTYSSISEDINIDIDLLSMYFTHYQMNNAHRSFYNPNIRKLASIILENVYDLDTNETKKLYPNIISQFSSFVEAKRQMIKDFLKPIRNAESSLRGKDCILLIESALLQGENLDELLINDCEALNDNNLLDDANILKFSTPLKFKGLERQNVALIINEPSALNLQEIYVGITRAKSKLKIYIVYE